MAELGKITKIEDLRTIWPHEAQNFTKWLSKEENLDLLSETLGINIVFEERESSVGSFNVDIVASEEGTNRKIIIENQLEDTNHDHLGKIITYASGKDAQIIIWIVKHARDEHKQAIEWLNQHTDENLGFFLLEIELWKIGDSLPAPKFNIVERPNDWAKMMKTPEGSSENSQFQLRFWQTFADYAYKKPEFLKFFSNRKPQPQHWLNFGSGKKNCSINLLVKKKSIGVDFYINGNKDLYYSLLEKKEDIEKAVGVQLEFVEASKDCRIFFEKSASPKTEESKWQEFFDWYINMAVRFKKIADDFI